MLKGYDELRAVDISKYCQTREGLTYLNWARCIDLLHKYGAETVYFEPVPDEKTGTSLRMADVEFKDKNGNVNRSYETRIKVVIDDKVYFMQTPVLNGSNPVKDNSMSQLRVWTSMCRAFVKCVAINTGLGFNLWLNEELQDDEGEIPQTAGPAGEAQIATIRRYEKEHGCNVGDWLARKGWAMDTLTADQAGYTLRCLAAQYGGQS